MKLPVVLALFFGTLILACSSADVPSAGPTPNLDTTVAQERAVDATVEARVAQELAVQPTLKPQVIIKEVPATATLIPTPTQLPTATPTPMITAKGKLIGIGFNVPKLGSVREVNQEYVASLDIPSVHKERFLDIQSNLNGVLGGYPNYLYIAFNKKGTERDAQPVFDRLSTAKFSGYEDGYTVAELIDRQSCLTGSNQGKPRTSTTNPYSICIENLAFIENPFDGPIEQLKNYPEKALGKLSLHYAHEYFHHYQRVHALDRGLDYQADRNNPETTVQAPTWWIEGAAVTFQNAWYKSNWQSLSFFKDKTWEDVRVSIADVTAPYIYKEIRGNIQGTSLKDELRGDCSPDWYLTALEDTYKTASDCTASLMATAYIAFKTSYKTVWIDIPRDYYDLGFWGAFEKHVGMTKQEFFDDYNEFLRSGDPDDDPPAGWVPPEGPISAYADFLQIIPESDPVDAKPHY